MPDSFPPSFRKKRALEVSIISPMHNEALCAQEFIGRITKVMDGEGYPYECVIVNDGSTDDTGAILARLSKQYPQLNIVTLARNSGQWAASYAGIQQSTGKYVVIMDSDLQHLPEEVPLLVSKIQEGYDLVSGARSKRKESLIFRRIPSLVANYFLRKITSCPSKDMGGFKCIRGDLARKIRLKAGQHRFLPALVWVMGGGITDVPISAPSRFAGKSHYGISRIVDVLLDIVMLWFQRSFKSRPIYLFGRLSLLFGLVSSGLFIWVGYEKLFLGIDMGTRPPFFLSLVGFITALGFISIGFILELLSDIYSTVNQQLPYAIKPPSDHAKDR